MVAMETSGSLSSLKADVSALCKWNWCPRCELAVAAEAQADLGFTTESSKALVQEHLTEADKEELRFQPDEVEQEVRKEVGHLTAKHCHLHYVEAWSLEDLVRADHELRHLHVDDILLRWANLRTRAVKPGYELSNFHHDLADCGVFCSIMSSLVPAKTDAGLGTLDPGNRYQKMCRAAMQLDPPVQGLTTLESIIKGEADLNVAYLSRLFMCPLGPSFVPNSQSRAMDVQMEMERAHIEMEALKSRWPELDKAITLCEDSSCGDTLPPDFHDILMTAGEVVEEYTALSDKLATGVVYVREGH
eukprot:gene27070-33304_t